MRSHDLLRVIMQDSAVAHEFTTSRTGVKRAERINAVLVCHLMNPNLIGLGPIHSALLTCSGSHLSGADQISQPDFMVCESDCP